MRVARWDLPSNREPWQRYVFFLVEPPTEYEPNLKSLANFFNWTMTYRRDSDVYAPYGFIDRHTKHIRTTIFGHPLPTFIPFEDSILRNKTRFGVWLVSHCITKSNRELIMNALIKHLDIDVWGWCGNNTICDESVSNRDCLDMINRNYKFVFAFENSICKDYVTEKYWSRVSMNVVPVVLNRSILAPFSPKDSFIAVDDFHNLEDFIQHLKNVHRNHTKYKDYIVAKRKNLGNYVQSDSNYTNFCQLCQMLHNPELPWKIYPDIHEWWIEKAECNKRKKTVEQFFSNPKYNPHFYH